MSVKYVNKENGICHIMKNFNLFKVAENIIIYDNAIVKFCKRHCF